MAFFGFEIIRKSFTAGAFTSAAPRQTGTRQISTWDVRAVDDGDLPRLEPQDVTEEMVLKDPAFPVTNENIFGWNFGDYGSTDPDDWKINPWTRCLDKTCERDQSNKFLFHVRAEFGLPGAYDIREEDLYLQAVPNSIAAYPFLRETVWSSEDKVIYTDANTGGKKELRLPTGSLYSEPFRRKWPVKSYRQTQFEDIPSGLVEDLVEERLFSTNDRAIFGDPQPSPGGDPTPPRWMIGDIVYQLMYLPVDLGANLELQQCYAMTYLFLRSSQDGGWMDRRALVDNYFLDPDNNNTKTPYRDPTDGQTVVDCLLDANGNLLPDQQGEPQFQNYRVQPQGVWSFVRQ